MNIVYINHYAGGPSYGMEYRPYYLAREWVRAGHSVTIVAASQSHVRSKQPAVNGRFTRECVDGVDFVWCETPKYQGNGVGRVRNIATFLLRLSQWRHWLRRKPDVVIASSTYPADIGPARRLARKHRAKLVWEVHDLWPLSPIELGGMSRWHPFILWMQHAENTACREADVIISMLPKADSHLRQHGMSADKFVHVPNGIEPAEWNEEAGEPLPTAHTAAIQTARKQGHLLIAYAGAHGVANALETVLDAASLTRQDPITWMLIGSGPEKQRLQQRVESENLDRIVMLDPVPKAAIPTLLKSMDVLYIGLQNEPLFRFGISPNKLMDYMMAARPILCAIRAGNDPVTEASCGLTIEPENPEALVDAIRKIHNMSVEQRGHMGRSGKAYVEKNHLYPVLANKFLESLKQFEVRN
ncbi:glycosyltransferase family 4 protein [Acidovorax sp. KKS102]|uniref:glycosyltransferase family 4 protein n=1 Tax=Acidovorax sp. KKS102 TaxID=358220 RepID=UPI0002F86076|nr:glycosyltransferase family 4 protein [Acidovorax sp. KKS102]